jgi:Tfp pilus assembly protein PilO
MLTKLGRKGIVAIAAVAGLVVFLAGWFLLVAPVKSDISKTKAATANQISDDDSLRLTISTMRSIAAKLPQETAELAVLNQRVPDKAELAKLLRSITTTATDTGVALTSLTPSVPAALASAPGVSAVTVSLNVTGGYAAIEQFDSALEALQRTFLVTGFSLSGSSGQTSSTSSSSSASAGGITASFTGQVLVRSTATSTSTGS